MFDEAFARDALRRCVLFSRADAAELEACLTSLRVRRYRRDETIFHLGDPGDALHVVARGAVKIQLPSPEGGEPAILVTLGPGEFFGELAILDGEPHSASAVALEPTETLVLSRAAFLRLLDAQPGVRRSLLAALAAELRRLTGHVETLHFLGLSGRLAHRIGELASASARPAAGPGPSGEVRVDWPYTQAELAGMVGGKRESINRILAEFVGRGLIRFEEDELVIADPDGLAREAGR